MASSAERAAALRRRCELPELVGDRGAAFHHEEVLRHLLAGADSENIAEDMLWAYRAVAVAAGDEDEMDEDIIEALLDDPEVTDILPEVFQPDASVQVLRSEGLQRGKLAENRHERLARVASRGLVAHIARRVGSDAPEPCRRPFGRRSGLHRSVGPILQVAHCPRKRLPFGTFLCHSALSDRPLPSLCPSQVWERHGLRRGSAEQRQQ